MVIIIVMVIIIDLSLNLVLTLGIGYAGVLVMQYVNIYYTVILGWAFYYMFASFQSSLPRSRCGNKWNTPNCVESGEKLNISEQNASAITSVSASQEYWE